MRGLRGVPCLWMGVGWWQWVHDPGALLVLQLLVLLVLQVLEVLQVRLLRRHGDLLVVLLLLLLVVLVKVGGAKGVGGVHWGAHLRVIALRGTPALLLLLRCVSGQPCLILLLLHVGLLLRLLLLHLCVHLLLLHVALLGGVHMQLSLLLLQVVLLLLGCGKGLVRLVSSFVWGRGVRWGLRLLAQDRLPCATMVPARGRVHV